MTAAFTVILPHKRNPGNDAALAVCLQMLMANTVNDFVLLMDAAYDAPLYERVNNMVKQATTDYCVYLASDTFVAPGWDDPMMAAASYTTFVNGVLVEPGAIAMYSENLHGDFGRKPETFRRADFETWCKSAPVPSGEGWFCPYMFPRVPWLEYGGLETHLTAPDGFTPADMNLFDRWKAGGNQIARVRSFAYHLQRYSDPAEQAHEKRSA